MNILITIPHYSNFIPKKYSDSYLISTKVMDANIDYATDKIFEFKEISCIKATASRFVVDLNRERNDFKKGQGVIITETWANEKVLKKELSESEVEDRLKFFYDPFYEKLDFFLNKSKEPLLVIAGHSMDSIGSESTGDNGEERPEICLAIGRGTVSKEILSLFEKEFKIAGYTVKINNPYSGKRAKLSYYCSAISNVQAIEVEINKKVYMDEKTFLLKEESIKKLRETLLRIIKKVKKL